MKKKFIIEFSLLNYQEEEAFLNLFERDFTKPEVPTLSIILPSAEIRFLSYFSNMESSKLEKLALIEAIEVEMMGIKGKELLLQNEKENISFLIKISETYFGE